MAEIKQWNDASITNESDPSGNNIRICAHRSNGKLYYLTWDQVAVTALVYTAEELATTETSLDFDFAELIPSEGSVYEVKIKVYINQNNYSVLSYHSIGRGDPPTTFSNNQYSSLTLGSSPVTYGPSDDGVGGSFQVGLSGMSASSKDVTLWVSEIL